MVYVARRTTAHLREERVARTCSSAHTREHIEEQIDVIVFRAPMFVDALHRMRDDQFVIDLVRLPLSRSSRNFSNELDVSLRSEVSKLYSSAAKFV